VIEQAWSFFDAGDTDTAMRRFNQAWLLDAENADVYWGMGLIENRRGNTDSAVALFQEGIAHNGEHAILRCNLASSYLYTLSEEVSISQKEDYLTRARQELTTALELDPENSFCHSVLDAHDFLIKIGVQNIEDPDRDRDGISNIDEMNIYGTDPENADSNGNGIPDGEEIYNVWRAYILGEKSPDKNSADVAMWKTTIALNGTVPNWHISLMAGTVRQQFAEIEKVVDNGALSAAQAAIDKGIATEPRFSGFYNYQGIVYGESGDKNKEISSYKKAIEVDLHNATAHMNLSIFYREDANDPMGALMEALIANAMDPQDSHIQNALGLAYFAYGDNSAAVRELRRAIELDPKYAQSYNNLGLVYREMGDYPQAEEYWNKALERDPSYVKAYNNLGALFKEKEEYPRALEYFEKAVEIDAHWYLPHQNMGTIYARTGESEKAKEHFDIALSLGSPDAGESKKN